MEKVTATINLQKSETGWSGIKKHVEHDPNIKHSNLDILKNLTQYNVQGEVYSSAEVKKKLTEFFGAYVEEHNQKAIEARHPERVFKSVFDFLNRKKKVTAVATVGDMETRNELIRQLCPSESYVEVPIPSSPKAKTLVITDPLEAKKFYGVYTNAFQKIVSLDSRNGELHRHLMPGHYAVHVDEAGAPHIHFEIFPMAKTAKGRPTNSLNQALIDFWKDAKGKNYTGREALIEYRKLVDRKMTKVLDESFREVYGDRFVGLKFWRKGSKDYGRSMEQVKNLKRRESEVDELAKEVRQKNEMQEQARQMLVDFADEVEPSKSKSNSETAQFDLSNNNRQVWSLTKLLEWLRQFLDRLRKREQAVRKQERTVQEVENAVARALRESGNIDIAAKIINNQKLTDRNGNPISLGTALHYAITSASEQQLKQIGKSAQRHYIASQQPKKKGRER